MRNRRNYYRILHVQPDAPTAVIRSSYRTMMQRMKMHPDLGGDCAQASLVNEAYSVLRDVAARKRYDEQLNLAKACPRAAADQGRRESHKAPGRAGGYPNTESSSGLCGFCDLPHEFNRSISPEDDCHRCASPLFPVNKQQLEEDAQRAVERIDRSHPLAFFSNGDAALAFAGRTQDVSLHGMQFMTDHASVVGDVIKIDTRMCVATARIVSCQPSPATCDLRWQIGVEFLTLRFDQARGSFVSARI